METAKLLSVFITTALGIILSSFFDKAKIDQLGDHVYMLYFAIFCFFTAICLYLGTLYSYDSLLMPSRFWGEAPKERTKGLSSLFVRAERPSWLVARPPSSSLWVLYQNMMYIWTYWFTSATAAVLLGIMSLAIAVLRQPFEISLLIAIEAILFVGFIWWCYKRFGPYLGSED